MICYLTWKPDSFFIDWRRWVLLTCCALKLICNVGMAMSPKRLMMCSEWMHIRWWTDLGWCGELYGSRRSCGGTWEGGCTTKLEGNSYADYLDLPYRSNVGGVFVVPYTDGSGDVGLDLQCGLRTWAYGRRLGALGLCNGSTANLSRSTYWLGTLY